MVGNSLKSDVLPVLAIGGFGVHVPQDVTWALEYAEAPSGNPRFFALNDLSGLPDLVKNVA
jgi:putative hydrolase of the HAD superfamily